MSRPRLRQHRADSTGATPLRAPRASARPHVLLRRGFASGACALMAACVALGMAAAVASAAARADSALADQGATAPAASGGLRATPAGSSAPSASRIDAYLASKGSPMTGQGAAFMASGARWQIDPRLIVAIAGAESSFGVLTCAPYNAWGWGCPSNAYSFESWADGIDTVSEGLRTNYLSEGRISVVLIHQKYAPVGASNDPTGLNNYWTVNVSNFLTEQGGNPANVDLSGVAGTMPLGLLLGDQSAGSFDFAEGAAAEDDVTIPAPPDDADTPDLVVAAGEPRDLEVIVHNTGLVAWRPEDVRLRRVDTEVRVGGAPYGAIAGDDLIEPNADATFHVQLTAIGVQDGTAETIWRLEGPAGPFGSEISRTVRFEVPAFVAGASKVEILDQGGVSGKTIRVSVQNGGSATWVRDGSAGVVLGVRGASGKPLTPVGWLSAEAAGSMLEREAAPGEWASFVFRVSGDGGALALAPFTSSGWAAGPLVIVRVGTVDPEQLAKLAEVGKPAAEVEETAPATSPRLAGDPADRGTGGAAALPADGATDAPG